MFPSNRSDSPESAEKNRSDIAHGAAQTSWVDVAWLAAMSSSLFLVLLSSSSYVASLPFIRVEWGLNNTQSGVAFSAYLAGYAASSLLIIPFTDRFRPFAIMLAGISLTAVSGVLFPLLAEGLWTASALRFLYGVGHVCVYITGIRLASLRFSARGRGLAVGVFVSSGYAGTTVSYVLMGILLDLFEGWESAYLATTLPGLVGVAVTLVQAFERRTVVSRSERTTPIAGWLSLAPLRDRRLMLVIMAYALHTAELFVARLWLPLLLGAALMMGGLDSDNAASRAATLAGLMFMTGIFAVLLGGWTSDRIGRIRSALWIFAVSGTCSFLAGWLVGLPFTYLVALGFLYGFFTAADSAIYSTAVTELAPRNLVGSAQALQSFIGFVVGTGAPVLAGSILDHSGAQSAWILVFSFNGVLAAAGIACLLWLQRVSALRVST